MSTMPVSSNARRRLRSAYTQLVVVSAGHLVTDTYSSFLAPLLPLFVARFGISLAAAGMLSAVLWTTSSLVQPLVGHLADTSGSRAFAVLGPLVAAAAMSAIGLATGPAMLVALVAVGGVGCAMFHPQGAAMAGTIDPARKGIALSAFATAGEAGYALGPLVVLSVVSRLGPRYTYLMILPGILVSILIYRFGPPAQAARKASDDPQNGGNWRDGLVPFGVLWLAAVVRVCVIMGFTTFLPLYLKEMGLPPVAYGSVASLFACAGTIGVVVGGPLADRVGVPRFLVLTLLAPIPFLWGFLHTPGAISYALLAFGGVILYAPTAVLTMAAQSLAPARAGTASALMMGVAWGAGSVGVVGVGAIADALGIRATLTLLPFALLAAAALAVAFWRLVRRGSDLAA